MDDERDHTYVTPLGEPDPDLVDSFWDRCQREAGPLVSKSTPQAWAFGDTVELADELIELVLRGTKRATASAVAEFELDGEQVPAVGDLSIVTDGSMRPRALLETTDVRIGPLSSVDDQFAWDEGEGDRTRASWLDGHTWFFSRTYARLGREFHPDIEVIFERFDVRYQED
jgi:uncharacterized protein YhfF